MACSRQTLSNMTTLCLGVSCVGPSGAYTDSDERSRRIPSSLALCSHRVTPERVSSLRKPSCSCCVCALPMHRRVTRTCLVAADQALLTAEQRMKSSGRSKYPRTTCSRLAFSICSILVCGMLVDDGQPRLVSCNSGESDCLNSILTNLRFITDIQTDIHSCGS